MKTLIAAVTLLLALASPGHAETETCIGRVKIDVVTDNEGLHIKGERLSNVGGCIFSEQDWKRILRTCPMGSRCRVEGKLEGDDVIETVTSVTRIPATPQGEWFLILDAWTCSSRTCDDPGTYANIATRDNSYEDLVINETFATRKQCLAKGRRLAWIHKNPSPTETYRSTKDENLLYDVVNGDTLGLPIGGFHPRCEWHRRAALDKDA